MADPTHSGGPTQPRAGIAVERQEWLEAANFGRAESVTALDRANERHWLDGVAEVGHCDPPSHQRCDWLCRSATRSPAVFIRAVIRWLVHSRKEAKNTRGTVKSPKSGSPQCPTVPPRKEEILREEKEGKREDQEREEKPDIEHVSHYRESSAAPLPLPFAALVAVLWPPETERDVSGDLPSSLLTGPWPPAAPAEPPRISQATVQGPAAQSDAAEPQLLQERARLSGLPAYGVPAWGGEPCNGRVTAMGGPERTRSSDGAIPLSPRLGLLSS